MNKYLVVLCIALTFSLGSCKKDRVGEVETPEGFIENNWDAILKAAQENDRPIYIHFYEPNCIRCAEFKEKTLNSPEVEKYISENYIGASLNNTEGKGKELENEYGITGHPASAVVNKDGRLKATKLGNLSKENLLQWLEEQK